MRLLSVLTAILVVATLYLVVFERNALLDFAGTTTAEAVAPEETTQSAGDTASEPNNTVSVVALRSRARTVDGAVVLRGRTEAVRQVELRAETSGRIVSDPDGSGLSEHALHHFHGLVLDAYRRAAP